MTEPICPACTEGQHTRCAIWTCDCRHVDCPAPTDQLTIDDALHPEENR